ncbi:MAG: hypothetical protein SPG74_06975, partial [Eubacteriales bacterium]|nr:hypothetical protein [Eubacteriales bacterium]
KNPPVRRVFEIRDKRENRREKVRLRRGLTKNRDEKSPLFFSYKVCIKELLFFLQKYTSSVSLRLPPALLSARPARALRALANLPLEKA